MIDSLNTEISSDLARVASNKKIISKMENREHRDNFSQKLEKSIEIIEKNSNSKNRVIDKKLMDSCVEMESLFVGKMLKEMRKTVHKGDFINGGHAEKIFEDMLYDEYALKLSKNSNLGLAGQLYDQLSRKV